MCVRVCKKNTYIFVRLGDGKKFRRERYFPTRNSRRCKEGFTEVRKKYINEEKEEKK